MKKLIDKIVDIQKDKYKYYLLDSGERKVSELSKIEMEMLLTDIVQRVLNEDCSCLEIEIIECLAEAELVELEEVESSID